MLKTLGFALVTALALTACGGAQSGSGSTVATSEAPVGSLTIRNGSSYEIHELHLSPADATSWGDDLLAGDPLLPGEGGTAPVFDCAQYDVRMVDDENVECVIQDLDLCFQDQDWTLSDELLTVCATGWAD
ncbi:MAG: hypothetical protein IPH44_14545 [Myxococcales bacterium]|nr:hypothetical protein [Myxococcales bacterium]MBK7193148.1 hypothetical protein [Myxococcales bacterium]MBP6848175.1 hypothetical protein [Kofleriaceae bacterium]